MNIDGQDYPIYQNNPSYSSDSRPPSPYTCISVAKDLDIEEHDVLVVNQPFDSDLPYLAVHQFIYMNDLSYRASRVEPIASGIAAGVIVFSLVVLICFLRYRYRTNVLRHGNLETPGTVEVALVPYSHVQTLSTNAGSSMTMKGYFDIQNHGAYRPVHSPKPREPEDDLENGVEVIVDDSHRRWHRQPEMVQVGDDHDGMEERGRNGRSSSSALMNTYEYRRDE
jgi:hypothetical protein